ncbi:hypothetical protein [Aeoliella sp. SH292]|uniref:hypothetical protein n=1 Tax=Aeoliella sp. SH292 TaxID=3454464 RepID=UPI003F9CF719
MSRRTLLGDSQQRDALAVRLRQLVGQLEALADEHCETFDYEGYTGLSEHAAELKVVLRVLLASDVAAELTVLVTQAEEHIAFIHEAYGGAP